MVTQTPISDKVTDICVHPTHSSYAQGYVGSSTVAKTYIGTVLAPHGLVLSCGCLYTHLHVEIKFPVSGCEGFCAGCCSVRKFGLRR